MTNYDKMKRIESAAYEIDGLQAGASKVWWSSADVMTKAEATRLSQIIGELQNLRDAMKERAVNEMK